MKSLQNILIIAVGFQKMIAKGKRMQIKNCLMRLALFLYGGIFYIGLLFDWKDTFKNTTLQQIQNERYIYGIFKCKLVFNNFKMLSFYKLWHCRNFVKFTTEEFLHFSSDIYENYSMVYIWILLLIHTVFATKGTMSLNFWLKVFSWIIFPSTRWLFPLTLFKFLQKFGRYSQLKVHHRCLQTGALIKKKIKFSSYIRKFRVEQLQSHIWGRASWYMRKCENIFPFIRRLLVI